MSVCVCVGWGGGVRFVSGRPPRVLVDYTDFHLLGSLPSSSTSPHQKKKDINLVSKSKVFWNSLAKKLVPVDV